MSRPQDNPLVLIRDALQDLGTTRSDLVNAWHSARDSDRTGHTMRVMAGLVSLERALGEALALLEDPEEGGEPSDISQMATALASSRPGAS